MTDNGSTASYVEPLFLVMRGGPHDGKRLSSSAMLIDFPSFMYLEEDHGTYKLVETNGLPPQGKYDLGVRVALYEWEPNE